MVLLYKIGQYLTMYRVSQKKMKPINLSIPYSTIQYNTNRFIFHSGHNMTYEEIYKEYSGHLVHN